MAIGRLQKQRGKRFIQKTPFPAEAPLAYSDGFSQITHMTDVPRHTSERAELPVHDALSLLGPDGRAGLMLNGMLYILRITKSGKLILTK